MDRGFGDAVNVTSKPEKEKQAVVATILAIQPEILGVCEIGGEADLKDLQARLKAAGLDLPNYETASGGDTTRTLGLLTKFPIVGRNSQKNLHYRIGDTVLPMQRGILDATIKVTEEFQIRAIGVHLKSMREVEGADQALMRRNESHLLREHLVGILKQDAGAKIVAYGDFNEHPNQAPIDELKGERANLGTVMLDVTIRDANGEVWTHFWDAADEYGRLDYFFASRELRPHISYQKSFIYTNRNFYDASDHRPIVLGLDIKATRKNEPIGGTAPQN